MNLLSTLQRTNLPKVQWEFCWGAVQVLVQWGRFAHARGFGEERGAHYSHILAQHPSLQGADVWMREPVIPQDAGLAARIPDDADTIRPAHLARGARAPTTAIGARVVADISIGVPKGVPRENAADFSVHLSHSIRRQQLPDDEVPLL